MRRRNIVRKIIWAGGRLDPNGPRDLSSNALPIPLDVVGLKRAGLALSVKAARLLASLCVRDRYVLTGGAGGNAGPLPREIGELQAAGVPLSIGYFQLGNGAFVASIRLDQPPFDLVDPITHF